LRSHAGIGHPSPIVLDWTRIKSISVIARIESSADLTLLDKFTSKLKKSGKKISVILIQSGSRNLPDHTKYQVLSDKDFNFYRIIKDAAKHQLPGKSDLLISAGYLEDPRLVSCCVLSKARIKISNQQGSPEFFDLIVPSELSSYINILRTQIDILKSLSPQRETAKL
jgi:hypothetical protein